MYDKTLCGVDLGICVFIGLNLFLNCVNSQLFSVNGNSFTKLVRISW